MEEKVILVDVHDQSIGEMEKMEAHLSGHMHRAISVLVFNDRHEMLLQQRAFSKYHTPGLWTNTCCSHPRPGETTEDAASRRLMEEMGIECKLTKGFDFIYKASFENGLIEHELDHVYIGIYNDDPIINIEEAHAFRWVSMVELKKDIAAFPEKYTIWFRLIMEKIAEKMPELLSD